MNVSTKIDWTFVWDVGGGGYKRLGCDYRRLSDYGEIDLPEQTVFLLCGAAILPDEFVKRYRIVNSHPGYAPIVRGLDSLKWAVYDGLPIGVTTHFLGDEVDAGEIIERKIVPVFFNDSFHAVAYRQYEMEIQLLVSSLNHIEEKHLFENGGNYVVHKRMPHSYETRLFERFEKLRKSVQIE